MNCKLIIATVFFCVTAAQPYCSAQQTIAADNTNTNVTSKHLTLSLRQAQDYALEHNYTLTNASMDKKKAEAAKWQALSSMLPQVSLGFDYQNMMGYEMNFGVMSIPLNPNGTFTATAAVVLTGQQVVSVMLADVSKQMSDVTRRQTIQSTEANVKNVYVSILVMQETMTLLDSSLANIERLSRTTENAVSVGAAEQVDADKLTVQVGTMRNTINSNKRALQMLQNSLLLQLGANPDDEITLTSKLDDILDITAANQMLYKGFDINKNFSYQNLLLGEKASKDQLLLAWMEFLPTLSAYYAYNSKTYFGKEEGMNMTPPNMIGASLKWNIFQSGSRAAKIKQAKIDYDKFVNSKQQAEDGLNVQYKQTAYDLVNALETYDIQKKNIEVSQRVFANVTEKFKYGRASSLEVTQASNDLITAQSSYIQAVVSVVSAQVALESLLSENQYLNTEQK